MAVYHGTARVVKTAIATFIKPFDGYYPANLYLIGASQERRGYSSAGERLLRMQEVGGSNPPTSTKTYFRLLVSPFGRVMRSEKEQSVSTATKSVYLYCLSPLTNGL